MIFFFLSFFFRSSERWEGGDRLIIDHVESHEFGGPRVDMTDRIEDAMVVDDRSDLFDHQD
jgi:hypothetical protein